MSRSNMVRNNDPLKVLGQIKIELQQQISGLTKLKGDIIKASKLEAPIKSKLRIAIESLLIDINEELYAISEELANTYGSNKQKNLQAKALEFEQRRAKLMKKVEK